MVDRKENYKFYLGVRELTSCGYPLRVISLYCPQFVLKGHWKWDHSNKTKNNFSSNYFSSTFLSQNQSMLYFQVRFCTLMAQLWHKMALVVILYNTPNLENLYFSDQLVIFKQSPSYSLWEWFDWIDCTDCIDFGFPKYMVFTVPRVS